MEIQICFRSIVKSNKLICRINPNKKYGGISESGKEGGGVFCSALSLSIVNQLNHI